VFFNENIVEECGDEGIPTRLTVGRKGKIQGKSTCFENDEEMMGEMALEIGMRLADDLYQTESMCIES
jgi:hypothetical protein